MIITIEEAFMIERIRKLPPEAKYSIVELLNLPRGEEQIKVIIEDEQIRNSMTFSVHPKCMPR